MNGNSFNGEKEFTIDNYYIDKYGIYWNSYTRYEEYYEQERKSNMSQYLGRVKNKGLYRRNLRALKTLNRLIQEQNKLDEVTIKEIEKQYKETQDGIKTTETDQNN